MLKYLLIFGLFGVLALGLFAFWADIQEAGIEMAKITAKQKSEEAFISATERSLTKLLSHQTETTQKTNEIAMKLVEESQGSENVMILLACTVIGLALVLACFAGYVIKRSIGGQLITLQYPDGRSVSLPIGQLTARQKQALLPERRAE